jgi:hypothetical protein
MLKRATLELDPTPTSNGPTRGLDRALLFCWLAGIETDRLLLAELSAYTLDVL